MTNYLFITLSAQMTMVIDLSIFNKLNNLCSGALSYIKQIIFNKPLSINI